MDGKARLRAVVDKPACCGYGLCNEICPEVFKLDINGIVFVDEDLVPEGMEERAREAADACPQAALSVEAV